MPLWHQTFRRYIGYGIHVTDGHVQHESHSNLTSTPRRRVLLTQLSSALLASLPVMATTSHDIVELPKILGHASNGVLLANRYRDYRLHALKTAPEAFAAAYETEVQRGIDHWLCRLDTPKASHIIAAKSEPRSYIGCLWEGMIVLLGPEDGHSTAQVSAKSDPFNKMTAQVGGTVAKQPAEPANALHFHLNGVFVDLPARGTGLGKRLVEAALNVGLRSCEQSGASTFHCTVLVDSENAAANRLYEKVGFKAVGSESYTQQPRALVDGEMEKRDRIAIQMELIRSVAGSSTHDERFGG